MSGQTARRSGVARRKHVDTIPPASGFVRRTPHTELETEERAPLAALGRQQSELAPQQKAEPPSARVTTLSPESAARRMVEELHRRGVDTYFGIPGGPVCPVFEALRLSPNATLVESRHESHAAFSAVAYHRATGKVPAIVVTAGPGVTNAVSGIASASLECVPLLVIAGDVAWASHGGRLAQQGGPEGLNIEQLLGPITRAQIRITNGRSAVGQTLAALEAATADELPGPALVILPIDKATETAPAISLPRPRRKYTLAAEPDSVRTTAQWLAEAKRPLLVLGGGCHPHADWVRQLVDVLDVPFVTTPRGKGVVNEEHPRSLRTGGMAASLWARRYTAEPIDVALVLGTDLDDTSIGPTPYVGKGGRLIHVDRNPAVFHRNLPTALGISADLPHFLSDLYQEVLCAGGQSGRARALLREIRRESAFDRPDFREAVDFHIPPQRAVADLEAAAGPDARFVTDIGEHMLFALHYLTARGPDRFHIQLNLGSMGSGIAGAVGLGVADPKRRVVCICGDGGMQMSGMELLTAKKLHLPILYAVFNDSRYNMVHHGMKQIFGEADDYATPQVDFAQWAKSMGVPARIIRAGGEIDAELVNELLSMGPGLLDIRIEKNARVRAGGRVEALQHMSMLTK